MKIETDMDFYGEYYISLCQAMQDVVSFTEIINEDRHCIEHTKCRIKKYKSVQKKLDKLEFPCTLENAKEQLFDMVGVRLICKFIGDIYDLSGLIATKYNVLCIKDYISSPKPNGYRSYHIIVEVRLSETEKIPVEMQLRTISQDSWASLEHQIKYKQDIRSEKLIKSELKRCADEMASTDLCMQTIKEFIEIE